MNNCKEPKCVYSDRFKKCILPNSYIEAIADCKRKNILKKDCIIDERAKKNACKYYKLRIASINKPKKEKEVKPKKEKEVKPKKEKEVKPKIEKEQKEERRYKRYIVKVYNKSILYNIDDNDVILDPAGLEFLKYGFEGAGGASAAIYKTLKMNSPNNDVIRYFNKFDDEDDLYENNTKNLSIAYYSKYNNYNIIHAVGPNFNNSNYLTNIIDNKNIELLYKLFYKIYLDIYIEFYKIYRTNKLLKLRLLPISTGIFIKNDPKKKEKIFRVLIDILSKLNNKFKINSSLYLNDINDLTLLNSLLKRKSNDLNNYEV